MLRHRLLRMSLGAAFAVAAFVVTRAPASAVLYLTESFTGASAQTGFVAGGGACLTATGTNAGGVPTCASGGPGGVTGTLPDTPGSGALRLTSNAGNQSGFVIYNQPTTSANGLQAIFTEYSYDTTSGTGADGISFFFLDATHRAAPTVPGAFGGSLGYAMRTTPSTVNGIQDGYLGIGLDEYGNFSNATEGRNGGPGFIRETVGIRGACATGSDCLGGNATGYPYITGYHNGGGAAASLPFTIDSPAATTRGAVAARRWRITLTTSLLVSVDVDIGSGFTNVVPATNLAAANGGAFPASFYFGFASSTGGSTNIHEITTLTLQSANVSYGLVNGPAGNPSAVGSFDGVSAVNDNDDFTERSFTPPGATAVYKAVPPAPGSTYTSAVSNIDVPHQITNTGNVADTYSLSDTAPAGWTVAFFADAAGGSGVTSPGAALGPAATNANTGTTPSIAAGATYTYWTRYAAPAGVATFTRFDAPINAYGNTVGTAEFNMTHDELYSGFIGETKAVAVTTTGCAAGQTVPAAGICPGGTLRYTIAYANIALAGGPNNTETNLTPSALLSSGAGTFKITEDGAASGNNWSTTTTGLQTAAGAAPADTTAGSTFLYGPAPGSTTLTAGLTRFVDTVGGAAFGLPPQGAGSLSFSLTVK